MSLASGEQLGPYEIVSQLGAGGMGEVYKARDTRLDRTVAIKILGAHLMGSPDLKERFEREARVIASLNHPHICVLHDVGEQKGTEYLVMEYLEGETLAQRLSKGPLIVEDALRYAMQIADALDKAHRQGITHRDLKPQNIMLTKSGAKLLDFGLAKLKTAQSPAGMLTALPTQSPTLTTEGTILGTFQYMAPEQVQGEEADARSDIFAFGAVLYEMLTGKKAFEGKNQASVIAKILETQPIPVTELQQAAPPILDRILRTCLAKDPDQRFQTAHDLLLQLQWLAEGASTLGIPAPVVAARKRRDRLLYAVTALSSVAALSLALVQLWPGGLWERTGAVIPQVRFSILPPEEWTLPGVPFTTRPEVIISPDGAKIAFAAVGPGGRRFIWVRPLNSMSPQRLEDTEEGYYPFWSPDSQFIGFFAKGKLKKIPVSGGSAIALCDAAAGEGATWNAEGIVVFSPSRGPLYRVAAAGGVPVPITKLEESRGEQFHVWPYFLPDGRRFLYLSTSRDRDRWGIYVTSLDGDEPKLIMQNAIRACFVPPDLLLFMRDRVLLAQRLDLDRLELRGEPLTVAENVNRSGGLYASFSVADIGLAFRAGLSSPLRRLVWRDRNGKELRVLGQPDAYGLTVGISPDEKNLLLTRLDRSTMQSDVWTVDLTSQIFSRFTLNGGGDAVWSPDSQSIVFQRGQDLLRKVLGSPQEQLVFKASEFRFPESWSPDGRLVLLIALEGRTAYLLSTDGQGEPQKAFETTFRADEFHISPDGRWVAYNSDESGRWEVYVASFPKFDRRRQVSNAGGCQALWRKDGKELFYLSLDGKLMAVNVKSTDQTIEASVPMVLFQTLISPDPQREQYSNAGDGERFLFLEDFQSEKEAFTVVLNWKASVTPNNP